MDGHPLGQEDIFHTVPLTNVFPVSDSRLLTTKPATAVRQRVSCLRNAKHPGVGAREVYGKVRAVLAQRHTAAAEMSNEVCLMAGLGPAL